MWNFEADKESSFEPIPAGTYNLVVTKAEMKETSKGDQRLSVEFTVTDDPEYAGRKIFDGYMLSGSEKAVQIGRGQIKSLLKVAGKDFNITGPEELLNIEIAASVKIQPAKDGYDAKNSISSFKPRGTVAASNTVPF